ncbi:DUF1990 domain-containing protein [Arthrobacter sp. zg-Y820]|uniref:DUF1990 family protein n=1 Tax=unclassified Arthrobacter TaxID=235627 RepID=UPI001E2E1C5D|nr:MULTISPECIES: DUF1990 domain-containing protein [unclassified Arthrobacter]MCC9197552.1 DUF1990 domain-containing protein [Arthrobacter sp. zg-Y820]MDK1280419.1 DUF1990 domain-containing protein [Arthrobacter sp. zg.Y820]WIB09697.1 DUF1990 domain-containing protein [Arthrobacter sp. zg-Y820]
MNRDLSYPDAGHTRRPYPQPLTQRWPDGYRLELRRERLDVPDPAAGFLRLANGILDWDLHRRAGLRVAAATPRAAPGVEMSSGVGVGPLRYYAPCRVLWSEEPEVDDDGAPIPGQRAGFGYGTLKGHPEQGEEGFYAELDGEGKLIFRVAAYSRPANRVLAAGDFANRGVQRFFTRRYLAAAYKLSSGS